MSWIKLDDQWIDHPKVVKAGRDARDMWLASITWCAKHLTDGFFPNEMLPSFAAAAGIDIASAQALAMILLDVCLWEVSGDGYQVHDFLDYNPSRQDIENSKTAKKEAGKRGGMASLARRQASAQADAQAKLEQNSTPSPSPLINTHTQGERQFSEDLRSDQMVMKITGWMAIPRSPENLEFMRDVPTIIQRKGEETEVYLRGFWNSYSRRYPGSTRLAWIGWALTGNIPPERPPDNRGTSPTYRKNGKLPLAGQGNPAYQPNDPVQTEAMARMLEKLAEGNNGS